MNRVQLLLLCVEAALRHAANLLCCGPGLDPKKNRLGLRTSSADIVSAACCWTTSVALLLQAYPRPWAVQSRRRLWALAVSFSGAVGAVEKGWLAPRTFERAKEWLQGEWAGKGVKGTTEPLNTTALMEGTNVLSERVPTAGVVARAVQQHVWTQGAAKSRGGEGEKGGMHACMHVFPSALTVLSTPLLATRVRLQHWGRSALARVFLPSRATRQSQSRRMIGAGCRRRGMPPSLLLLRVRPLASPGPSTVPHCAAAYDRLASPFPSAAAAPLCHRQRRTGERGAGPVGRAPLGLCVLSRSSPLVDPFLASLATPSRLSPPSA